MTTITTTLRQRRQLLNFSKKEQLCNVGYNCKVQAAKSENSIMQLVKAAATASCYNHTGIDSTCQQLSLLCKQ